MSSVSRATFAAATAVTAVAITASPAAAWAGGPVSANAGTPISIQMGTYPLITCPFSALNGTINAGGMLNITTATFNACTFSGSPPVTVTAHYLPWSGLLNGGSATLNGVRLSLLIDVGNPILCGYSGNLTGTYTGTASPVTASFSNTFTKVTGPLFCSSTITFSSTYVLTGSGL
ncbi:hypothetical protein ABGB12_13115 [Actinocorallia sp. B10E7]|uniref:hypothetical protein n=1 Tax=Actinocorallia sp. B10E7 TaxID=3153558 RepID=UPI00325C840D